MSLNKTMARLGLAALLTVPIWIAGCDQDGQQSSSEDASAPQVGVVTVTPRAVELFTQLPGRTSPYRVAEVRPQVGGIITKRLFTEGSQVEAGQTLYQIDPRPYRAALASAKADLAKARAAVTSVQQRAQRFAELLEDHAVSEQEYDDVRATLAQNRAQVEVAQAALDMARLNLNYASITAPISGVIGASNVTEGALVTASQDAPLAQITRLDPIYVDMARSSSEFLRLKREFANGTLEKAGPESARTTMTFDDYSQYERAGKLKFSGVTVDPGTSAITLRAIFPNPDNLVLPGMFVSVRVSEGVKQNVLMVPQQGITHGESGQATALVVDQDNKVRERKVETRKAIGSFWLVTDGLSAGERVIVSGRHNAKPGNKVAPVAADIPNKPADNPRRSSTPTGAQTVPASDKSSGPQNGSVQDG